MGFDLRSRRAEAGSENSYDVDGKKSASGHTVSFAALEIKKGGDHDDHGGGYDNKSMGGHGDGGHGKPQSIKIFVIAGGSSGGSIKH